MQDPCVPPASFLCPIMGDVMRDPVTAVDGHSYDRVNITRWLAEHDSSPATGATLDSRMLIPNIALRNAIEEWEDLQHSRQVAATTPTSTPAVSLLTDISTDGNLPLQAGSPVFYIGPDGSESKAQVLVVHPGSLEDPDPYYTIALADGERDTVSGLLLTDA